MSRFVCSHRPVASDASCCSARLGPAHEGLRAANDLSSTDLTSASSLPLSMRSVVSNAIHPFCARGRRPFALGAVPFTGHRYRDALGQRAMSRQQARSRRSSGRWWLAGSRPS
jgi:hypothetical protein